MHSRISIHQVSFPATTSLESDIADLVRAGFKHIGLLEHKLADRHPAQVRELLDSAGIAASTLTHAPLFAVGRPELREERIAALLSALDVAAVVGAPSVYGTTGPAIGVPWAQAKQEVRDTMAGRVTDRAGELGIPVLVEMTLPLYAENAFVYSLCDTLDLVVDTALGINLDFFGVWTEPDLETKMRAAAGKIKLCQVSDYRLGTRSLPARLVPGDGDVPLRQLIASLLDTGYDGLFELELQGPAIDGEGPANAAERAGHALGDLLASLGL